jgi:hypothetical protein
MGYLNDGWPMVTQSTFNREVWEQQMSVLDRKKERTRNHLFDENLAL